MTYPSNADTVIVQHYWWDDATRTGVDATVTWTPVPYTGPGAPNLTDATAHGWIKTREWVSKPDPITGYHAVPLTASNDPDLSGFVGYRVTPQGETAQVVAVDVDALSSTVTEQMRDALAALTPPVLVTVGAQVKTAWLTDIAIVSPAPTPPSAFFTKAQTTDLVLDAVSVHDEDPLAHADIRALVQQGSFPDATTTVKGKAVLLGGTADAPTVPYGKVTGAPASLPPSGGAGGVLSGSYPAPGFAVDMATQSELDAHTGNTSNPHATTKGQVGLGSVDNTSDTSKPVSTAQQSALDTKATRAANLSDLASPSSARTNLGLSAVAASGAYTDLSGRPTIPATYSQLTGTVPQSALPALALTDFLGEAASQAAMLALTGQRGDWCTRTDRGTDWQLVADDSTQLASWRERVYPASPVSSVNGRTGAVSGLAENSDARFTDMRPPTDGSVTDAKVASGAAIAESKLSLASDAAAGTASRRTLGTGAQQAAAGNDSRITGAASQSALTAHTSTTANPHATSKAQIGLGNVDNTSDAGKPISTATQAALDGKSNRGSDWTRASGAIRTNMPRNQPYVANASLTSGRLVLAAIPLYVGDVVTALTFLSGNTSAANPTNQWFTLYDSTLNLLAVTVDDTSNPWPSNSAKTLALTAPYSVTAMGLYYAGIMVAAGTVPSIYGVSTIPAPVMGRSPVLAGSSTTGLTTPGTAPSPAAALTAATALPYVELS